MHLIAFPLLHIVKKTGNREYSISIYSDIHDTTGIIIFHLTWNREKGVKIRVNLEHPSPGRHFF